MDIQSTSSWMTLDIVSNTPAILAGVGAEGNLLTCMVPVAINIQDSPNPNSNVN
jgi:hypothetical protein